VSVRRHVLACSLHARQLVTGFGRPDSGMEGRSNVSQAESVELATHPTFPVRYPGGISRRTWAQDLRLSTIAVKVTDNWQTLGGW